MADTVQEIIIDEYAGFCAGVRRAIKLAEDSLDSGKRIFSVGELIHNEKEIERLERRGLVCISPERLFNEGIPPSDVILFRAHGEGKKMHSRALKLPNKLIDGTCTIVRRLQKMVEKAHEDGRFIILVGKKKHPEVLGLQGQCDQCAEVVLTEDEVDNITTDKPISVFAQTTIDENLFDSISRYIKKRYPDAEINKTICKSVLKRRSELGKFIKTVDMLIFVGGKHSSNTRVLFEFCKTMLNRTFFIAGPEELAFDMISEARKIGISGSASTPRWLMEQVKDEILKLTNS